MLFNKKKKLPYASIIQDKFKKDNDTYWDVVLLVRLKDIVDFNKKVFKELCRMKADFILVNNRDLFVSYDDFVQATINVGIYHKYENEINQVYKENKESCELINHVIKEVCDYVYNNYDHAMKLSEELMQSDDKLEREKGKYLEHIICLTKVQGEPYNRLCQIAYEYVIKNHVEWIYKNIK